MDTGKREFVIGCAAVGTMLSVIGLGVWNKRKQDAEALRQRLAKLEAEGYTCLKDIDLKRANQVAEIATRAAVHCWEPGSLPDEKPRACASGSLFRKGDVLLCASSFHQVNIPWFLWPDAQERGFYCINDPGRQKEEPTFHKVYPLVIGSNSCNVWDTGAILPEHENLEDWAIGVVSHPSPELLQRAIDITKIPSDFTTPSKGLAVLAGFPGDTMQVRKFLCAYETGQHVDLARMYLNNISFLTEWNLTFKGGLSGAMAFDVDTCLPLGVLDSIGPDMTEGTCYKRDANHNGKATRFDIILPGLREAARQVETSQEQFIRVTEHMHSSEDGREAFCDGHFIRPNIQRVSGEVPLPSRRRVIQGHWTENTKTR